MKKYILTSLTAAALLTACLKEDQILTPKESNPIIEIYNEFPHKIASTIASKVPLYIESFPAVAGEIQDFNVYVSYSGADQAPEDITVTLSIDPTIMDTYNDQWETNYEVLPTSLYTVETLTLTIKKGEKRAHTTFKLKTAEFDFSKAYALPIAIQSASTGIVSTNYGRTLFAVMAKNKYDGIYTMKSRLVPAADRVTQASGATFTIPESIHLITVDANSVVMYDNYVFGDYIHPFRTLTGWSGYGSFAPVFTIDDNGNLSAVRNWYTNPTNGRTAILNEDVTDSRYDEATKTLYAAIIMNQPTWEPLPIYDTLVFVGDR